MRNHKRGLSGSKLLTIATRHSVNLIPTDIYMKEYFRLSHTMLGLVNMVDYEEITNVSKLTRIKSRTLLSPTTL
jgi:hypothetical protein